jgi:hypothetical protein
VGTVVKPQKIGRLIWEDLLRPFQYSMVQTDFK